MSTVAPETASLGAAAKPDSLGAKKGGPKPHSEASQDGPHEPAKDRKVPKGGPKKPPRQPRPEEIPFKIQIDEKSKNIARLQAELAAINRQIYDNKEGSSDNDERSVIKSKLDEIQSRINSLDLKRNEYLDELDTKQKDIRKKSKSLTEMKMSIGFKSEEEINHQIRLLEGLMMTSSLSLKEEKQMMAQLQQLRASKLSFERIHRLESQQSKDTLDGIISCVKSNLDSLREEMAVLRKAKREESQKLFTLNENKKKTMDNMKEHFDAKARISKEIQEEIQAKQRLIKELEELNNEYYAKQKALHLARVKKQQEDRERRSLENEVRSLSNQLENCDFLPHDKEVKLLQQILVFIDKLEETHVSGPASTAAPLDATSASSVPTETSLNGTTATRVIPKKERDEYFITPKAGKKERKSKDKSKSFKLDMVTLSYFESAGVEPPTSVDGIAGCKLKVQEKLDFFLKERAKCNVDELKEKLQARLEAATKKLEEVYKDRAPKGPE